jgi:hypothetical protein
VPIEQLQDAGRLAERADALFELRLVDRIHEPDAAAHGEGVRGPLHAVV